MMDKVRKSKTKIIVEGGIERICALEDLFDNKYPMFGEQCIRRYKVKDYGSIDVIVDCFNMEGTIEMDKEVYEYLCSLRYNKDEKLHKFLMNLGKNMEVNKL
ncbi:MAG: hypothetical protein WC516_08685 [Patescibacteria group bacterium]|jgi:hypothetical protein